MKNLLNAQTKFDATKAKLITHTVVKTEANTLVFESMKSAERECKKFLNRKTELNKDDQTAFSALLTQYRYRVELLYKGAGALEYAHKMSIKIDLSARNTYGKVLSGIDFENGIAVHAKKYEQGNYLVNTVMSCLIGDPIESEFSLTAGQIGRCCASTGVSVAGSTQPYAVINALVLIGAGKRINMGKGEGWKNTKIVFDPQSAFIKSINAQFNQA